MERLNIGVVGVGHLGSLHAKMLSGIPSVLLAGIFDVDLAKAERVSAEFEVTACASLDQLLRTVDAVTIATTTTFHFDAARKALEAGKHVFIEKPITQTVEEARELCDLARRKNLVIQVGHIERFNPAILALEKYNLDPMFVESHRLAQFNPRGTDVAVVLDLMIHDIDVILSFVKAPVVRVDANGLAVVSDSIDIANARMQFENGCVANVTASRISQRKMRKMRLFQRNEYISIDFSEGLAEVFKLVDEGDDATGMLTLGEIGVGERKRKIIYGQPEVKEVNALRYELEMFARSASGGPPPVVSGEDGKRALEVAHSIMEKIRQQPVQSI